MNIAIVINVLHPEWEGSRVEQVAARWEREGLVRRLRPGRYVVTAQGIDAGMVEELREYRRLCARYQAALAKREELKAEYERDIAELNAEYESGLGAMPKEGTTDER